MERWRAVAHPAGNVSRCTAWQSAPTALIWRILRASSSLLKSEEEAYDEVPEDERAAVLVQHTLDSAAFDTHSSSDLESRPFFCSIQCHYHSSAKKDDNGNIIRVVDCRKAILESIQPSLPIDRFAVCCLNYSQVHYGSI